MSSQVVKSDLANFDKRFDDLTTLMSQFAHGIQIKFDQIDSNLTQHNGEFKKLNEKYEHLIKTIDSFISRIDSYEIKLTARDKKIERLERWIQPVASKSGITLT